jgi:hypothetical protein
MRNTPLNKKTLKVEDPKKLTDGFKVESIRQATQNCFQLLKEMTT